MKIGSVDLEGPEPLFVAEIGACHDGRPETAIAMLRELANRGVRVAKLQTYTSEDLVSDGNRKLTVGSPGQERETTIRELFDSVTLPKESYPEIFAAAKEIGIELFSTPFSCEGVEFLSGLGVGAFKIAASDLNYHQLIRAAAETGLPVILSCGKCTMPEVGEAVEVFTRADGRDLALLHCVAEYPAPIEEMSLSTIPLLRSLYGNATIGLSDHSLTHTAAIAATVLGARIIEKHVTYDRGASGPDHWFSLDYDAVEELLCCLRETALAIGTPRTGILNCELKERNTSVRSLIATRDLGSGDILRPEDIAILRPGTGIPPKHRDDVIGLSVQTEVAANTPLQWSHFKQNAPASS